MIREFSHRACKVEQLETHGFADDPAGWFVIHSNNECRDVLLLSHADDGVSWGRLQGDRLITSSQLFKEYQVSPPLRAVTLQQACLFREIEEVRVWRKEGGFQACRITDTDDENAASFDEAHILWGTHAEGWEGGFTLLADGQEGLRHAVPLDIPASSFERNSRYRPLRLLLRHYLVNDSDGCARICLSRLLGLRIEPSKGKGGIEG